MPTGDKSKRKREDVKGSESKRRRRPRRTSRSTLGLKLKVDDKPKFDSVDTETDGSKNSGILMGAASSSGLFSGEIDSSGMGAAVSPIPPGNQTADQTSLNASEQEFLRAGAGRISEYDKAVHSLVWAAGTIDDIGLRLAQVAGALREAAKVLETKQPLPLATLEELFEEGTRDSKALSFGKGAAGH